MAPVGRDKRAGGLVRAGRREMCAGRDEPRADREDAPPARRRAGFDDDERVLRSAPTAGRPAARSPMAKARPAHRRASPDRRASGRRARWRGRRRPSRRGPARPPASCFPTRRIASLVSISVAVSRLSKQSWAAQERRSRTRADVEKAFRRKFRQRFGDRSEAGADRGIGGRQPRRQIGLCGEIVGYMQPAVADLAAVAPRKQVRRLLQFGQRRAFQNLVDGLSK